MKNWSDESFIASLLRRNNIDFEAIWFQTNPIPNLSNSESIWFRTCLFPNLSDSKPVWFWTYLIQNLSDSEPIWFRTYLIPNLTYSEPLWSRTNLITNLSGFEPVWFRTCLIPNHSDSAPIWFPTCMVSHLSDSAPIWFQSHDDCQPLLARPEAILRTKQVNPSKHSKRPDSCFTVSTTELSSGPLRNSPKAYQVNGWWQWRCTNCYHFLLLRKLTTVECVAAEIKKNIQISVVTRYAHTRCVMKLTNRLIAYLHSHFFL
jgi:hypothetical protein